MWWVREITNWIRVRNWLEFAFSFFLLYCAAVAVCSWFDRGVEERNFHYSSSLLLFPSHSSGFYNISFFICSSFLLLFRLFADWINRAVNRVEWTPRVENLPPLKPRLSVATRYRHRNYKRKITILMQLLLSIYLRKLPLSFLTPTQLCATKVSFHPWGFS